MYRISTHIKDITNNMLCLFLSFHWWILPVWGGYGSLGLGSSIVCLSNGEGGWAPWSFRDLSWFGTLSAFPKSPDVSAEGLQESGDVYLLQRLFAVVHCHQDVLIADAVGLLQAAVHTWRSENITIKTGSDVKLLGEPAQKPSADKVERNKPRPITVE